MEIRKYFELKENKNEAYQNVQEAAKIACKGKCIYHYTPVIEKKKVLKSMTSNQKGKTLKKEEQMKHKGKRKEMVKNRNQSKNKQNSGNQ